MPNPYRLKKKKLVPIVIDPKEEERIKEIMYKLSDERDKRAILCMIKVVPEKLIERFVTKKSVMITPKVKLACEPRFNIDPEISVMHRGKMVGSCIDYDFRDTDLFTALYMESLKNKTGLWNKFKPIKRNERHYRGRYSRTKYTTVEFKDWKHPQRIGAKPSTVVYDHSVRTRYPIDGRGIKLVGIPTFGQAAYEAICYNSNSWFSGWKYRVKENKDGTFTAYLTRPQRNNKYKVFVLLFTQFCIMLKCKLRDHRYNDDEDYKIFVMEKALKAKLIGNKKKIVEFLERDRHGEISKPELERTRREGRERRRRERRSQERLARREARRAEERRRQGRKGRKVRKGNRLKDQGSHCCKASDERIATLSKKAIRRR